MSLRPILALCRPLRGPRVAVPASKSVANRELVLSALAKGTSRLGLGAYDPGDDVRAMRDALRALGYAVDDDGRGTLRIVGSPAPPTPRGPVDAREGGTVGRFILPVASLSATPVTVDGSARLRERPIAPLLAALRTLGASVEGERLPVVVRGPLAGGAVTVPGHESSQFASALLLAGARMRDGIDLRLAGTTVHAPFLEVTSAALTARGVKVGRPAPDRFVIARQTIGARTLEIPGDVTAASYPAAAAAILGGEVTITNADARRLPGAQGDARFFELLERMGCRVSRGPGRVTVARGGRLIGVCDNLNDISDTFPTLAAVAAVAETPTEITGVGHTRRQESDRVAAVAAGLRALGARVSEFADGLAIQPAALHGGTVSSAGDHRIAMSFSVLGLAVPGVVIDGWEATTKTFPEFYDVLGALGR